MTNIIENLSVLPYVVKAEKHSEHPLVLSLFNDAAPGAAAIDSVYRGQYRRIMGRSSFVSLETIVDMGFTGTTTVRARSESSTKYWRDATMWMHTVDNRLYDTTARSAIKRVTWGIGGRLAIACWSLKGELNVTSLTAVAAQASTGVAGTYFDAQLLGADSDALKIFLPILHKAGGNFTLAEARLLDKVNQDLIDYFDDRDRQPDLTPSLISVDVDLDRLGVKPGNLPITEIVGSEHFALERGKRSFSADAAIAHSTFDPDHWQKATVTDAGVRLAYEEFFHVTGGTVPDKDDRDVADRLLWAGSNYTPDESLMQREAPIPLLPSNEEQNSTAVRDLGFELMTAPSSGLRPHDVAESFAISADDPNAEGQFSAIDIHMLAVSAKMWGEVKMEPVTGNGGAEVFHFLVDVMVYTPKIELVATVDGRWAIRRWGCGFRVGAGAWSQEAKLTADLKQVAATAEFKSVGSDIQKGLWGVDHPQLSSTKLMRDRQRVNAKFLQNIAEAAEELARFMSEKPNRASLTPVPLDMFAIGGAQYTTENVAWSHVIATHGVDNQRPLKEQLEHALKHWPGHTLPAVVTDVYRRCYGVPDGETRPSPNQKDVAKHIIMKGR